MNADLSGLTGTTANRRDRRAERPRDEVGVRQIPDVHSNSPSATRVVIGGEIHDPVRRLVLDAIVEWREKDRALPPRVRTKRKGARPADVSTPFEPQPSRPERCVVQPVAGHVPSHPANTYRDVLIVSSIQPGEMSACADRPSQFARPFELNSPDGCVSSIRDIDNPWPDRRLHLEVRVVGLKNSEAQPR